MTFSSVRRSYAPRFVESSWSDHSVHVDEENTCSKIVYCINSMSRSVAFGPTEFLHLAA